MEHHINLKEALYQLKSVFRSVNRA